MQDFMQQNKHIIPWKCHVCGGEFSTMGGGTCEECGKPTCNTCFGLGEFRSLGKLKMRVGRLNMPETRICRSCADKKQSHLGPKQHKQ